MSDLITDILMRFSEVDLIVLIQYYYDPGIEEFNSKFINAFKRTCKEAGKRISIIDVTTGSEYMSLKAREAEKLGIPIFYVFITGEAAKAAHALVAYGKRNG